MWLNFSLIHYFVCKTYVGIILELRIFEMEQEYFLGCCRNSCHFISYTTHCHCNYIPWLMLVLFSWSTTLHSNVHDFLNMCLRWNLIASRNYFNFCFYYSWSYTPNPSWVVGGLLWCIHSDVPFRCSQWQRHAWNKLSFDGRYLQVRMVVVFLYPYFLWVTLSLGPVTCLWMLAHLSHCSVIVTYNDKNYKTVVAELIL